MVVWVVVGVFGVVAGVWLMGYLMTALLDANRPREAAGSTGKGYDRPQPAKQLAGDRQDVRHRWGEEDDSRSGRAA